MFRSGGVREITTFLLDLWEDGFVGKITAIVVLLTGMFIVGSLLYAVDVVYPSKEYIIDKPMIKSNFTPAHTTTSYIMSGKVLLPITTYHPDDWSLIPLS